MSTIKRITATLIHQMHNDDYDADMESEIYHNRKEAGRCRDNSELLSKVIELLKQYKEAPSE